MADTGILHVVAEYLDPRLAHEAVASLENAGVPATRINTSSPQAVEAVSEMEMHQETLELIRSDVISLLLGCAIGFLIGAAIGALLAFVVNIDPWWAAALVPLVIFTFGGGFFAAARSFGLERRGATILEDRVLVDVDLDDPAAVDRALAVLSFGSALRIDVFDAGYHLRES
jgi:hypothetical protein